jgi:competence protein ComEC
MLRARLRKGSGVAWPAAQARPLASLAAGFVAGAALSRAIDPAIPLLALAAAALLIIRSRHPALVALLGVALGGLRQEWAETREPEPLSATLEGIVSGPPRVYRSLEDPGAGEVTDGSFVVGRTQVRYFRQDIRLLGGERVRCTGKPRRPRPATNPGQFDYAAYLARQGIDSELNLETLEILEGPPFWSRSRAWFRSLFDRGMRPEVGRFGSAIVLGRREAVDDALVRQLQRSGTAHLLAISGQNLVIVAMSLWALLVLLGVHGRAQTLVLLALLGLYALLTGLQVSVVRSFLMIATFLGADLAWRKRDAISALGTAALVICLLDPGQVADAGFQLSFAAVLGLSFIAPVFHAFSGSGGWIWNRARLGLGVSLAAWLATAPITLAHFNLLTPGIVLANLLLVPLISLEFVLGLAHLPFAALGAGALTGAASGVVFDGVRAVSAAVTAIPASYVYLPAAGAGLIVVYYAFLAGWTAWCRTGLERWWKPASVVAVVLPLGLTPLSHRPPDGVLVTMLDVGRGSCAYMEWPDGRNLMVDCGSLNARDPGESVAAPYVWSRGLTRLHTLVLSHPDSDHVNGARSVIDLLRVRRVVVTRRFEGWSWPPGVEVVVAERPGAPRSLDGLEILGPPVWEKFGAPVADNETSIVLRAGGALFTGDIEERGAEELLTLPDLRARVLVMPHHGKHFKQHRELVARVAPERILVSAPQGYFDKRVIDALPVPPDITGRRGAIEIIIKPTE